MIRDAQGNPVSGATGEAALLFDQAVEAFNIYRGDPVGLLGQAIAAAPDFAMAHIAKAHLFGLATEPEATKEAQTIVGKAKTLRLSQREASHVAALELLLQGNWTAAAEGLDRHNAEHPHDIVALQCGHLMDFYRASARGLRDRIARVLPKWSPDIPGYSILLGMQSFGLEETADYGRAEEAGRRALDLQPLDCWAHHAVAHVMEMQGRAEDGIGWMIARQPHWSGDDNFFKVHNWWHRALYHLDLGQVDQVFELYDGPIRQGRSMVVLDMVDASALLWRLQLSGHDVGDRWNELAATGTAMPMAGSIRSTTGTPSWPISAPAAAPTSSAFWTAIARQPPCPRSANGAGASPCRWSKGSRRSGAGTTGTPPTACMAHATSPTCSAAATRSATSSTGR